MTNIFKSPEKSERKRRLFEIGIQTLEKGGWSVSKAKGLGKSSVRRITKNGESKLVSIRTTQDKWLAFPPKPDGKGWFTLDDVDVVLAVSFAPKSQGEVWAHWIPADELRKRYDLAYQARKKAKRVLPQRRGVWIPLYHRESDNPENVSFVGGGAGLDYPKIASVPLNAGGNGTPPSVSPPSTQGSGDNGSFAIAQAKRLLSSSLGVPESSIKIIIEA